MRQVVGALQEPGRSAAFGRPSRANEQAPGGSGVATVVGNLGEGQQTRRDTRPESLSATEGDRFLEGPPCVVVASVSLPRERDVPDRVGGKHRLVVSLPRGVGCLEVRQGGAVIVPDDLMDDPDPEPRPCLQDGITGTAGSVQRSLEMGEFARVLDPFGEELRVQDPTSLGLEAGLHAIELDGRGRTRVRRPGEQRLLVEDVGAEQAVVPGQGQGFMPPTPAAQPGKAFAIRHQPPGGLLDAADE